MMMKSTIRTLFLLSALLFSACEKDDSIFTELSIRFVMPDSRPVEKLEIRTDISYFDNINSGERAMTWVEDSESIVLLLKSI